VGEPFLLAVDDDAAVCRAVERDLRRQYGERFRVLRAESGADALELVQRIAERDEQIALLLVDQRMPQMTGVEFLARAMAIVPDAKRVLLTAYADTEAAIRAINDVRLDYYLMKPWDPPQEHLYPVLDDLLDDWLAGVPAPYEGTSVIGHRWSSTSHRVRDFLTRNQVPYRWLDVEGEEAGRLLAAAAVSAERLPVVLLADGTALIEPSPADIAARVGLKTQAELAFYDLVIVGGGPAGLAAAVYGASEGLRTVMVEREAIGGQAGQSARIENYLGFPSGVSGGDLARRATVQARRFGAELLTAQEAVALEVRGPLRLVRLADGSELATHTVLVATGVSYRRLEVPGLDGLVGAGVYYGAAASEASVCEGEHVFVVGGANSAGQAAMFFSRFARAVSILYRGDSLERGMSHYLVDQIRRTENIAVHARSEVVEAHGNARLEAITVEEEGRRTTHPAGALFIFIGAWPHTEWLGNHVARGDGGFILAGPQLLRPGSDGVPLWPLDREPYLLETSVPGVFVAGDVRDQSIKRCASAVGEGAMAVQLIHRYLGAL
jgi:thioredoxin reductase (NADPH)